MVDHSPPLAETASCRCARQPCPPDQIDAAVRTAAVYGARRPTLASRPETFGLALLLLINRNDEPARRIVRDARCIAERIVVDQALCVPAEDFAAALTGKESCAGWRGGAVASLCTLGGRTVTVRRATDGTVVGLYVERAGLIASLMLRLRGFPRESVAAAFDALVIRYRSAQVSGPLAYRAMTAERAGDTARLRSIVSDGAP